MTNSWETSHQVAIGLFSQNHGRFWPAVCEGQLRIGFKKVRHNSPCRCNTKLFSILTDRWWIKTALFILFRMRWMNVLGEAAFRGGLQPRVWGIPVAGEKSSGLSWHTSCKVAGTLQLVVWAAAFQSLRIWQIMQESQHNWFQISSAWQWESCSCESILEILWQNVQEVF